MQLKSDFYRCISARTLMLDFVVTSATRQSSVWGRSKTTQSEDSPAKINRLLRYLTAWLFGGGDDGSIFLMLFFFLFWKAASPDIPTPTLLPQQPMLIGWWCLDEKKSDCLQITVQTLVLSDLRGTNQVEYVGFNTHYLFPFSIIKEMKWDNTEISYVLDRPLDEVDANASDGRWKHQRMKFHSETRSMCEATTDDSTKTELKAEHTYKLH